MCYPIQTHSNNPLSAYSLSPDLLLEFRQYDVIISLSLFLSSTIVIPLFAKWYMRVYLSIFGPFHLNNVLLYLALPVLLYEYASILLILSYVSARLYYFLIANACRHISSNPLRAEFQFCHIKPKWINWEMKAISEWDIE